MKFALILHFLSSLPLTVLGQVIGLGFRTNPRTWKCVCRLLLGTTWNYTFPSPAARRLNSVCISSSVTITMYNAHKAHISYAHTKKIQAASWFSHFSLSPSSPPLILEAGEFSKRGAARYQLCIFLTLLKKHSGYIWEIWSSHKIVWHIQCSRQIFLF